MATFTTLRDDSMEDGLSSKPSSIKRSQLRQTYKRAFLAATRVQSEMSLQSKVVKREKVDAVPLLDNNEVIMGDLLGSGSYCHVAEIKGLDLDLMMADSVGQCLSRNHLLQLQSSGCELVIKFLRKDLPPDLYSQGAAKLVLEMILLSSLEHQHIVRLHGVSKEGPNGFLNGKGYFICTERLYDTLEDRLRIWRGFDQRNKLKGKGDRRRTASRLAQRLQVAVDLASAISFLHSKKIVFRDLNPCNVRFDANDSIKLVGFQLARELEDARLSEDGTNYHLSGAKGELCFQAPEVAMLQAYNTKADVFSFTILLWQICSVSESVYPDIFTREDYINRVVVNRERPRVHVELSDRLKTIIMNGWSHHAEHRPTMQQMQSLLKAEVETLRRKAGDQPPPTNTRCGCDITRESSSQSESVEQNRSDSPPNMAPQRRRTVPLPSIAPTPRTLSRSQSTRSSMDMDIRQSHQQSHDNLSFAQPSYDVQVSEAQAPSNLRYLPKSASTKFESVQGRTVPRTNIPPASKIPSRTQSTRSLKDVHSRQGRPHTPDGAAFTQNCSDGTQAMEAQEPTQERYFMPMSPPTKVASLQGSASSAGTRRSQSIRKDLSTNQSPASPRKTHEVRQVSFEDPQHVPYHVHHHHQERSVMEPHRLSRAKKSEASAVVGLRPRTSTGSKVYPRAA